MDPRLLDLLRYCVIFLVLLVGGLFIHKHYKRYQTKKEIVAELQGATSDSSFYRQFEADDAKATLLKSIALIQRAEDLGLPPTELFDRVFQRDNQDDFGGSVSTDYPVKEELVRNALTGAYEAAKRLEMLDPASLRDLKDGRMPILPGGTPVILPLIDPQLSPGLDRIIPNLEILPADRVGKKRQLTAIEVSAARTLAKDLENANLIERSVADAILLHYQTPPKEDKKSKE